MKSVDFAKYVFDEPYLGWLLRGVSMTLVMAVVSGIGAAILGFWVLRGELSRWRFFRTLGGAYVTVFRNVPILPLLLLLMFGVPGVWLRWTGREFPRDFELVMLLVGLSLNTGAYLAEILRAGVQAVSPLQLEAGRTLGLSPGAIRRKIVYPQAIRIVAPALTSRLIHNTKNSTMALIVPLPLHQLEVLGQASRIAGETFTWIEPLCFAACVHLVLALVFGQALNRWARGQQARVEGAA